MTRVYAGLGSNVDKEKNIPAGLNTLSSTLLSYVPSRILRVILNIQKSV